MGVGRTEIGGPDGLLAPTVGIGDYHGLQADEPIGLKPQLAAMEPGAGQQRVLQQRARPHKLSTIKKVVRDIHGEARIVQIPIDNLHEVATAQARKAAVSKRPPGPVARVDHHQVPNASRRFNPDLTDSEEEEEGQDGFQEGEGATGQQNYEVRMYFVCMRVCVCV